MANETTDIPVPTDQEGYLMDPADWDDDIARLLASREDIALGDAHWAVIRFMRDYYDEHLVAADARFVIKFVAEKLGKGDQARVFLFQLFPYGHAQQVCKIAGMRKPRAWSTG